MENFLSICKFKALTNPSNIGIEKEESPCFTAKASQILEQDSHSAESSSSDGLTTAPKMFQERLEPNVKVEHIRSGDKHQLVHLSASTSEMVTQGMMSAKFGFDVFGLFVFMSQYFRQCLITTLNESENTNFPKELNQSQHTPRWSSSRFFIRD
ncbi:hypothetical protein Tco_0602087 [Tanacetum coccineum]